MCQQVFALGYEIKYGINKEIKLVFVNYLKTSKMTHVKMSIVMAFTTPFSKHYIKFGSARSVQQRPSK